MSVKNTSHSILLILLVLLFATGLIFAEESEPNPGPYRNQAEGRKKAVDMMRAMATIPWTPQEDITYWVPKYGKIFLAGQTYKGIPYTQRNRKTNLAAFQKEIEDKNGVPVYVGPTNYLGTDCSSSVSIAWQTVTPKFPILRTRVMFPEISPYIKTVGRYRVTTDTSTTLIINQNGEEVICAAYDKLQPGDAVLKRNMKDGGHIMMVTSVNPVKKEVTIIDQTGVTGKGILKGGNSTWRVDKVFTYQELLKDAYIPVTLAAFAEY